MIADRQIISILCPRAGQAVDFVDLPSCRAGTYFRYAAKVSKGASKERGKPFGAVSLSPLKSPLPSTVRGTPPRVKRAGSYVIECVKLVRAQLTIQIETAPTSREPRRDIESVRHRAFMRGGEPRSVER